MTVCQKVFFTLTKPKNKLITTLSALDKPLTKRYGHVEPQPNKFAEQHKFFKHIQDVASKLFAATTNSSCPHFQNSTAEGTICT